MQVSDFAVSSVGSLILYFEIIGNQESNNALSSGTVEFVFMASVLKLPEMNE